MGGELFTVEVVPAVSGTPTGNVTVKNGAVAACVMDRSPDPEIGWCFAAPAGQGKS